MYIADLDIIHMQSFVRPSLADCNFKWIEAGARVLCQLILGIRVEVISQIV